MLPNLTNVVGPKPQWYLTARRVSELEHLHICFNQSSILSHVEADYPFLRPLHILEWTFVVNMFS